MVEARRGGNKYSVLMPTYEERDNLPIITYLLFQTAEEEDINLEVVIVDDNSPDGTQDIIRELQKIYGDKLKLHARPGKLGLGSAYIDGLAHCTGNFIILMDADLSHHVSILAPFPADHNERALTSYLCTAQIHQAVHPEAAGEQL